MRFTEHELTVALKGSAKAMLAVQRKESARARSTSTRRGTTLTGYQRFTMLDALGGQLLPVLEALPDVEVPYGTAPTFTDQQIRETVERSRRPMTADGCGARRW